MKKGLAICLAASMLLSMGGVATASPVKQGNAASVYTASSRIGEGVPVAGQQVIDELNQAITRSLVVNDTNAYVRADYQPNGRKLLISVNTYSAVKDKNYLQGLQGTGFKTSVQNFLRVLAEKKITAYKIGSVEKTVSGTVTADQLQSDFTAEMQNKLIETTGNFLSPYFGTMEDLSGIGDIPSIIVFTDDNGNSFYVDYVVSFVPTNWAV